jgi:hypothetical protein
VFDDLAGILRFKGILTMVDASTIEYGTLWNHGWKKARYLDLASYLAKKWVSLVNILSVCSIKLRYLEDELGLTTP